MSDHTLLRWSNIPEDTSLKELVRILNRRKIKLDISPGGEDEVDRTFGPGGTPGLLMDLDPNELLGIISDGNTTSYCPDATGNGNDATQSSSGQYPTMREAVLGQYPVLEFHSSRGDLLGTPLIQNICLGGTIFLVARMSGPAIEHSTLVTLEETGESKSSTTWLHVEESIFGDPPHDVLTWSLPATEVLKGASNWFVLALVVSSNSSMVTWVNGVEGVTINPDNDLDVPRNFTLGGGAVVGGSGTANFQFARALWFDSALTDTQVASEMVALQNMYNIHADGRASVLDDDLAIANTETVVVRYVAPANTLTLGTTFRVWAHSTRSGTNTATPTYRVRIGDTTLTGNVAASLTGVGDATADPRWVMGEVTIRSVGSSATVIGGMVEAQNAVVPAVNTLSSTVTFDSTEANYVELTFQSGHADNTYTFRAAGVEVVRR